MIRKRDSLNSLLNDFRSLLILLREVQRKQILRVSNVEKTKTSGTLHCYTLCVLYLNIELVLALVHLAANNQLIGF